MGRSSSTGYPFLISRGDAGQYTYNREIPAAIADLVVGEVLLPWSGRKRRLAGTRVVKISLATGDQKTARQRWGAVHPQVDALVHLAELRVRGHSEAERRADVPRLDRAVVRRVADQAYHDVLAADDRTQVEPGFVTPLAGILLKLDRGSAGQKTDEIFVAERAARAIEQRVLQDRLRRRKTHMMDVPIEQMEVDGEALCALPSNLEVGDRLAPEQIEALAHGIHIGEIAGEVEQRLRENNLDLPLGHGDRRELALAITRAKLRAIDDVRRRDRGAPIDTPDRPAVVPPRETQPETPVPNLLAMQEMWIRLVRPGDKQIGDNRRYTRLFTSLHGDLTVDKITGAHVRAFRDALLECPRNAPKRLATASLADLAAWAKANPSRPKLGRETINHKGLGAISALLQQPVAHEHIKSNPANNQELPIKPGDKQQRRPFSPEELNLLFGTAIYRLQPEIPKAGKGWAAYWLPLLGLFTGARLEELGQALVSDIKIKRGIDYLEVTTLSGDEDDDGSAPDKKLKSQAARRRVPLHKLLIQLGFLDYVAFLRAVGAKRLFPDLDEYRERYTKNWSRWWGRWLEKHALTDPALTFHSFRHTFTAELRRLKTDVSVLKELLGHAQTDVTSSYGRIDGCLHELSDLNDAIQRITFESLEISRLAGHRPWLA